MKLLVVLCGLLALSASHVIPAGPSDEAIPTIPGDNSHYVEGESRYVWMPDGEGNPVLVDLDEPVDESVLDSRNGANNQYWLFTRRNPNNAQIIRHNEADTITSSNYQRNRPLKVIVHGWNNNGNTAMNPTITSAFLAVQDCNVIVVDWRALANSAYNTAANGVPNVGEHLGKFLTWLINTGGGNWNQVHLVGFSLGAHVVGNAGREAGNRPARITGLDPAGPRWGSNSNALNGNNGQYVEAIHTDGHLLGIFNPVGDADFYPNGGKNPQPGCLISTCSHGRSTDLFASSVRNPNRFVGRQCNNIWDAELGNCNGGTLVMGNSNIGKRGRGLFGLRTGSSWPF
ncbi:pancreatic lipase-related protein 2-like [Anticarsia gemmatalis]|uniref:pancreatic lipase-related protein 2-like n=1 Tax=Anticarsia gemmatalis TaxID=129554 RepID=UPI003F75F341